MDIGVGVYDVLNVFNAIGVIKKDKNKIKYLGGPIESAETDDLKRNH